MNTVVKLSDKQTTNGADDAIKLSEPWVAEVRLKGCSDFLFHRWNNEAVEAKAKARKNSAAKKTDNVESYVYRNEEGILCIPGEYLRGAMVGAAKFRQDPRSPRKSAQDLFKAAIISLPPLASLGKKEWDYEDRRRVVIQRNGITRVRPAMRSGWQAEFRLLVNLPEYVDDVLFQDVLTMAGKLIGLGDFRPTYGRFDVTRFDTKEA